MANCHSYKLIGIAFEVKGNRPGEVRCVRAAVSQLPLDGLNQCCDEFLAGGIPFLLAEVATQFHVGNTLRARQEKCAVPTRILITHHACDDGEESVLRCSDRLGGNGRVTSGWGEHENVQVWAFATYGDQGEERLFESGGRVDLGVGDQSVQCEGDLTPCVECKLGEQVFFVLEVSIGCPSGNARPSSYCSKGHRLRPSRIEQFERRLDQCRPCRRGGFGS